MKKNLRRALFLVLMVMGVFLPNSVSAKEYDFGVFYNNDKLSLFDGDKLILNNKHEYSCGGGQSCKICSTEEFSLYSVTYNGRSYITKGYSFPLENNYVFNYRKFINHILGDREIKLMEGGGFNEEDEKLVNSLLKDTSKRPYVTPCSTATHTGCFDGYRLCLNFDTKIVLDLGYLETYGATHDNPLNYKREDGTIVLKDLQRDDYEFGGWYLDSDYKYRVTEISEEFANDYFTNEGNFKDVDKYPAKNKNGSLI